CSSCMLSRSKCLFKSVSNSWLQLMVCLSCSPYCSPRMINSAFFCLIANDKSEFETTSLNIIFDNPFKICCTLYMTHQKVLFLIIKQNTTDSTKVLEIFHISTLYN